MPGIIVVAGFEIVTNTDILQGTRLQTVPASGFLFFEIQADVNDATNAMTTSIQMPNGDTPLNAVLVPSGNTAALAGVIDDRTALRLRFRITQGGHCVFSVADLNGTAVELSWRVTYTPG